MALERNALGEELLGARLEPRDGRAATSPSAMTDGTRPESALTRDAVDEREASTFDRGEPRERLDPEMVEVGGAVGVGDLELVPEVERDCRAVVARPEVGCGRRSANADDAHRDASAIASGSGSTVDGRRAEPRGGLGVLRARVP